MFSFLKSKSRILKLSKERLAEKVDQTLTISAISVQELTGAFQSYKLHNEKKFDSFFHICVITTVIQADLILLLERYQLSNRKYEQHLMARMIALTIIEFLDDINLLIGRDLLKELDDNGHIEFKSMFKEHSRKFSLLKKDNESTLRLIRNNAIAHKSKDSLKLVVSVFEFDAEAVYDLGLEVNNYATELNNLTTEVFYKLIEDQKDRVL